MLPKLLLFLLQAVPPVLPDTYTVGVVGDNQNGPTTFAAICQRLAAEPISLFVGVGDHVQNGLPSEWTSQWQQPLTPIAGVPRMGAIGNHDDVPGYVANVWPSQQHALTSIYGPAVALWTATTVGGVRWVFLDTNEHPTIRLSLEPGGLQRQFLEQEITSTAWANAGFRIVAFHHPYRTEYWDGGCYYPAQPERDTLMATLTQANPGPTLILNGHSHAYQRGAVGGRAWIISGGGGGFLDTTHCWDWPEITVAQPIWHYLAITVTPAQLLVRVRRVDGSLVEEVILP